MNEIHLSHSVPELFKTFYLIPNMATPLGVRVRMTDRPTLLEWVPILMVNNYSKFAVNIFSKDRDIRKGLIVSENAKSKKGHNYVKN